MISREQFQEKINSFDYSDEQKEKCLAYYDNDSKSANKENVIDNYDAEKLWNTVNRWYGIKNSTKEKKPRKKTVKLEALLQQINDITDSVIATNNEDDMDDLSSCLSSNAYKVGKVLEEIDKKNQEEYNNIIKAIKEFNKKNNTNYNLVNKID